MKNFMIKLLYTSIIILFVSFLLIEGFILNEGRKTPSAKADYIIILGARLYGKIPSPSLRERLKVAKEYLIENKDVKVVCSGGQGENEDISEAEAMKIYLIEKGIEGSRIILEDQSTNTFENLWMSIDEIRKVDQNDEVVIFIATNKYHIFRSKMLAERLGMVAYGLPAEIPKTIIFKSYIREYFAVIKSFLMDRL